ncbi:MAG TPA: hypothetical protein VGM91_05640 [Conexibacter sp.]
MTEARRVQLTGDLAGDFIIEHVFPDGRMLVRPNDSAAAMNARNGLAPATLDEFEAEHGPVAPPDGEG